MPQNCIDMDEKYYNGFDTEKRLKNIRTEGDKIISSIKTDKKFCQRFFYGTDKRKCNIARFRSKHIGDLKHIYNVIMSENSYSTIIYEALWAEGTWAPLDTYDKQSTFFAWLKKVAWNTIIVWLKNEHIISEKCMRTAGSTRLTMLSQSAGKCKLVIDELMKHTKYYDVLTAIYVDRLKDSEIMANLNLSTDEYKQLKKQGERNMKDAILRSANYYEEDVLHDKSASTILVSSEFVMDMAEWYKERIEENPFSDVLGLHLTDEEVKDKIVSFIYDFSQKLKWTDEERYIWRKRFVENVSPVQLAEEMNKDRHWIDQHYSRINKKFKKALKKWWEQNG